MSIYSASAATTLSSSAPAALPPFLSSGLILETPPRHRDYVCPKAPCLHGLPEGEAARTSPLELEGRFIFMAEGKYERSHIIEAVNRWVASAQFPDGAERATKIFFDIVGIFHKPLVVAGGAGQKDVSHKETLKFDLDREPFVIKPSHSFLKDFHKRANESSGYLVTLEACLYRGSDLIASQTWVSTFSSEAASRATAEGERERGFTV